MRYRHYFQLWLNLSRVLIRRAHEHELGVLAAGGAELDQGWFDALSESAAEAKARYFAWKSARTEALAMAKHAR